MLKRFSFFAVLAVLVATTGLAAATPAHATITTKGNNAVTLTVSGAAPTFVTTILGINGTVTCTTFSTSGTKDAAADKVTGKPTFAGCTLKIAGGSSYVCNVTTAANWSIESGTLKSGTSWNLTLTLGAITITCTTSATKSSCTIQIAAQSISGLTFTDAAAVQSLEAVAVNVKSVTIASDCLGIAVSNATSVFTGTFNSSTNKTIDIS